MFRYSLLLNKTEKWIDVINLLIPFGLNTLFAKKYFKVSEEQN